MSSFGLNGNAVISTFVVVLVYSHTSLCNHWPPLWNQLPPLLLIGVHWKEALYKCIDTIVYNTECIISIINDLHVSLST